MDVLLNHVEDGRVGMLDFLDPINVTERRWLEESLDEGHVWRESIAVMAARRHPVSARLDIEPGTMSVEFMNLAVALFVIAIRYPSVFWAVNKSFGIVFSLQLLINNMAILITYSAASILYKVQVFGAERALLRYPSRLSLDMLQSAMMGALFIVSLIMSSCVVYMYGLQKLAEWREREYRKAHITQLAKRSRLYGYLPHFLAFISLMLISLSAIPMMYDLILVYCGSLDGAALVGATTIAVWLFLWMLLWLAFTIKHSWNFATLADKQAEAAAANKRPPTRDTPLLVIDHGQTFQIREAGSKQAIRSLAHRARQVAQAQAQAQQRAEEAQAQLAAEEDVYWLKPKPPTPTGDKEPPKEGNSMSWLRKKKPTAANRVGGSRTLEERSSKAKVKRKNSLGNLLSRAKKENELNEAFSDDGDYATLRQIVIRDETDDNLANKSTHLNLCPLKEENGVARVFEPQANAPRHGGYELLVEHKPAPPPHQHQLLSQSHHQPGNYSPLPEPTYGLRNLFNPTPNPTYSPLKVQTHSEVHQEHPPPQKMGSISSESSSQQSPEKNSDTSSGIHSGTSPNSSLTSEKRSASAENLMKCLATTRAAWKSSSLQRGPCAALEVKCPRVNCIAENPYQHLPPPPPLDEGHMVVRRSKRPQTEITFGHSGGNAGNLNAFTRATNMRMTSFTENLEAESFLRDNALPFPPQPRLFEGESPYGTYGMTCSPKPVVSIAPQMPPQMPPYPTTSHDEANCSGESEFIVQLQKNFL